MPALTILVPNPNTYTPRLASSVSKFYARCFAKKVKARSKLFSMLSWLPNNPLAPHHAEMSFIVIRFVTPKSSMPQCPVDTPKDTLLKCVFVCC